MKKVIMLSIAALALIAFAVAPIMSGENCATKTADKTASKSCSASKTDAVKASAKESACSASKADAIKASAKESACSSSKTDAIKASASANCATACSKEDMAACAAKLGITVEELDKMCGPDGNMQMQTISIKGMTCGGCEADVTKAIEAVGGVHKVVSISYKDENAVVCVEKEKTCLTTLTKTIADKGYQAEVVPAVAKTTEVTSKDAAKGSCATICSAKEQAACADKKAKEEKKAEGTR